MPDMTKKLDRFTAAILAEAAQETERTLQAAQADKDAAYATAEDAVLLEAYQYIHGEVARIKREAGRHVSRRMLDNKRALYLRRGEIAQEVLGLVQEKIAAFVETDAYAARLEALYRQALEPLEGADDVEIFLRPADLKYTGVLERAVPGVRPTFAEGDFQIGGLIAASPARGLRCDATFDSAAEALSGHFAELFGLSLSDSE